MKPQNSALRVCFPFVGDTIGGSHVSALLLLRNLDPKRYQPVVVVHEEGLLSRQLNDLGVDYVLCPLPGYVKLPEKPLRNYGLLARTTPVLMSLLRRHKVSLVHTNDFRIHTGWAIAARFAGCKLIWHQHTARFGSSRFKSLLARLAHRVVCISEFSASRMPPFISQNMIVVSNPFDTRQPQPDRQLRRAVLEGELHCKTGTRIVGFFGNLTEQKRPLQFVRAAALMKQASDTPLVFVLFGADRDGNAKKARRIARELEISGDVRFVGFRWPAEPWMAACDVVLAPAIGEGFGRSVVEAMFVGTPVVATNSGGHAEIIRCGETGVLVAPEDAAALAEAALRILRDPDYAKSLAMRAAAYVRQTYSIDRHVTEVMQAYDRLLGAKDLRAWPDQPVTRTQR